MKRINKSSVTEALMDAMEHAEEMECVVVLYQNKPGASTHTGFITNDEATMETTNFMVDAYKAWLFRCALGREADEG